MKRKASSAPAAFKSTAFAFGFENVGIDPRFGRSVDNSFGKDRCMLV
mgnify:FL=1